MMYASFGNLNFFLKGEVYESILREHEEIS